MSTIKCNGPMSNEVRALCNPLSLSLSLPSFAERILETTPRRSIPLVLSTKDALSTPVILVSDAGKSGMELVKEKDEFHLRDKADGQTLVTLRNVQTAVLSPNAKYITVSLKNASGNGIETVMVQLRRQD